MNQVNLFSSLFIFIILFIISISDIKKKIINLKLVFVAYLYILFVYPIFESFLLEHHLITNILERFYSSLVTLFSLFLVEFVASNFLRKVSLGHGDILLASMGSAWIGIKGIFIALAFSFFIAGLKDFFRLIFYKQINETPFAPYLSLSIFVLWIFGVELIDMLVIRFF